MHEYQARPYDPEATKGISMPRIIVGLGGLLSNPACCVIKDGQLASAVEQAKISRSNRLGSLPDDAFNLALNIAGINAGEIECIALARPFALGPESAMQLDIRARFPDAQVVVIEHHHAHA